MIRRSVGSGCQGVMARAWVASGEEGWRGRLSRERYGVEFAFDVRIPMRDGVQLSACVWRPEGLGRYPCVMVYTPYDCAAENVVREAEWFARRGYAVVSVDSRGRYRSDGQAYLYWHRDWVKGGFEGLDVYDAQTWVGQQPWCDGKIGMHGPSALAIVQWLSAYLNNPYLVTLIAECSPGDHYNNVFPGGAFQLGNSLHLMTMLGGDRVNNEYVRGQAVDWAKAYWHLPLRTTDQAVLGKRVQLWQDFIDHPSHDEYWRFSVGQWLKVATIAAGRYPEVKVPTLNITGWYDQVAQDTINNYIGMVQFGPVELRGLHQLIVGPWRHARYVAKTGDIDFGVEADVDLLGVKLRWFDYWLKGEENGVRDEEPVQIFVTGKNEWRCEREWPLRRATYRRLYLHSGGHANGRFGDGRLDEDGPAGAEESDEFIYNPGVPVPTCGGAEPWQHYLAEAVDGPRDRAWVECRGDVLVYTSGVLTRDTEVTGRVVLHLYAASSCRDTDFTGMLVDVWPSGYCQLLREGIIRARYRESFVEELLLEAGKTYEYVIDLGSMSHVFQMGHCIRLEVSSSNFPKYDRNPNTGCRFGEEAAFNMARQVVWHDAAHGSFVELPMVV